MEQRVLSHCKTIIVTTSCRTVQMLSKMIARVLNCASNKTSELSTSTSRSAIALCQASHDENPIMTIMEVVLSSSEE